MAPGGQARVKGDLIIKSLKYFEKKFGQGALDDLDSTQDDFKPQVWYPFEDFISLLDYLVQKSASQDIKEVYRLGHYMIVNDVRWAGIFKGRNPADVFTSNKNQDHQYEVGDFKGIIASGNMVSINSTIWAKNDDELNLWSEFYRGRIQGVLDLTGYSGKVERFLSTDKGEHLVTYNLTWY